MPDCVRCGRVLPAELKIVRETLCPHCSAYLHACVQCVFHDPHAHNQCREPQAEFVANREKANFCEFWKLGTPGGGGPGDRRADDARARLDALFRKPGDD
ncbi:MAG: hypothetical protein PVF43_03695 [Candidatus Eiseniibacteriota bacterium]|jgi:hypothetical protein